MIEGKTKHFPDTVRERLLGRYPFILSAAMKKAASVAGAGVTRQFFPDPRELEVARGERADPIGDDKHSPLPFLVHRYRNRVLWKIVTTCAVSCRFCFRRDMLANGGVPGEEEIAAVHAYLRAHEEVEEVILSGGDPMTVSARRLVRYLEPLADIVHVRRIRVHTRVPVVAPSLCKPAWLALLEESGKEIVYVLHVNHPGEFTAAADSVVKRLSERYLLLAQTVLLRGVNDDAQCLKALMDAFLARRVHPYYLHHLDLARGTGHFRLTLEEGKAIYRALREQSSGIALPTYLVEMPGGGGKVPVMELSAAERKILRAAGIP